MKGINIFTLLLSGLLLLASCAKQEPEKQESTKADQIVQDAIETMGGNLLDQAEVTFDFRGQPISYYNDHGKYRYTRTFRDTASNEIRDTLTNLDFIRYKNGQKLNLTEEEKQSLQGGLNSIIYFALLPYRLNDAAVIKEYIDTVAINGKDYHKIKVTFEQDGGGEDHDDTYYYFFDIDDLSLDYLSYDFRVNDGGIRFRSAYNTREINGLTIQDYINYMVDPESVDYFKIESYYNRGQLKELSRIQLKDVKVKALPEA